MRNFNKIIEYQKDNPTINIRSLIKQLSKQLKDYKLQNKAFNKIYRMEKKDLTCSIKILEEKIRSLKSEIKEAKNLHLLSITEGLNVEEVKLRLNLADKAVKEFRKESNKLHKTLTKEMKFIDYLSALSVKTPLEIEIIKESLTKDLIEWETKQQIWVRLKYNLLHHVILKVDDKVYTFRHNPPDINNVAKVDSDIRFISSPFLGNDFVDYILGVFNQDYGITHTGGDSINKDQIINFIKTIKRAPKNYLEIFSVTDIDLMLLNNIKENAQFLSNQFDQKNLIELLNYFRCYMLGEKIFYLDQIVKSEIEKLPSIQQQDNKEVQTLLQDLIYEKFYTRLASLSVELNKNYIGHELLLNNPLDALSSEEKQSIKDIFSLNNLLYIYKNVNTIPTNLAFLVYNYGQATWNQNDIYKEIKALSNFDVIVVYGNSFEAVDSVNLYSVIQELKTDFSEIDCIFSKIMWHGSKEKNEFQDKYIITELSTLGKNSFLYLQSCYGGVYSLNNNLKNSLLFTEASNKEVTYIDQGFNPNYVKKYFQNNPEISINNIIELTARIRGIKEGYISGNFHGERIEQQKFKEFYHNFIEENLSAEQILGDSISFDIHI